jgi:hypothetical protein
MAKSKLNHGFPGVGAVTEKLEELLPNAGEWAAVSDEQPQPTAASEQAPVVAEKEQPKEQPKEQAAAVPVEAKAEPAKPLSEEPKVDPWAEYEEIEVEDDGGSYRVRAPKEYARKVRDGFVRRSLMDRHAGYLAKYRPLLEPLISSGQFEDLATMIAFGNQQTPEAEAFRRGMYELFMRAVTGKPVSFADQVEAKPSQAPQPAEDEDDVLGVRKLIEPLASDLAALKAEYERQQKLARQQAELARMAAEAERQTVAEFASYFPGEFTGDPVKDGPALMRVFSYAQNAGMFARYNPTNDPRLYPAVMRLAKLEMDRSAVPSAAASAVAAAEEATRAAREEVARVASQVAAGGSESGGEQVSAAPPLRDAKGRPVSLNQLARFYEERWRKGA